ncbi:HlyD family efflux transporter periplasmic adaptor subunit [Vacuolonema iberomarrocanum]|uniref:HlyD family efflux transporter periplasmic adaptor subunit n=1 Tax=Vacuolonema iberomarrocanum TaxID=3454632 RepID=UPI003F6DC98F
MLSYQALSEKFPRRWLLAGGVILAGALGVTIWGGWQWRAAQIQDAETQLVQEPQILTVTALGRLEPSSDLIDLTAPTSSQENRIESLLVEEGDVVESGEIIAILDSRDRLQAALQQAEEQVRVAEAGLNQIRAGAQSGELQAQQAEIARLQAEQAGSVAAQRAAVARLEAEVQNARIEYERYESLYQEGAVSTSERDSRQLTYDTAERQLQQAQADLTRIQTTNQQQIQQAEATFDQLAEVRPVDVAAAEAEVAAAIAQVEEAKATLEQAYVRSPRAGQIIEIHTQPGEVIDSEGVATLGQTQQMMAIAEVYQTDIATVAVDQSATVTSPAIPNELQGTVERIGLRVGQQEVVDDDPAANLDARVVEVHVRLDPASSRQVEGLTNLQVTVQIQTE